MLVKKPEKNIYLEDLGTDVNISKCILNK